MKFKKSLAILSAILCACSVFFAGCNTNPEESKAEDSKAEESISPVESVTVEQALKTRPEEIYKFLNTFLPEDAPTDKNIWWTLDHDGKNKITSFTARYITEGTKGDIFNLCSVTKDVDVNDLLAFDNKKFSVSLSASRNGFDSAKSKETMPIAEAFIKKEGLTDVIFIISKPLTSKDDPESGYNKYAFIVETKTGRTSYSADIKSAKDIDGFVANVNAGEYKIEKKTEHKPFGKIFLDANTKNA